MSTSLPVSIGPVGGRREQECRISPGVLRTGEEGILMAFYRGYVREYLIFIPFEEVYPLVEALTGLVPEAVR